MGIDVTIKIGGEAGQGIQTVGSLLASACQRAGLYMMAINDFESRIRGGHNFFHSLDDLVAILENTVAWVKGEIASE